MDIYQGMFWTAYIFTHILNTHTGGVQGQRRGWRKGHEKVEEGCFTMHANQV
jgi:hypothetical protein